jgi:hypothetical protein
VAKPRRCFAWKCATTSITEVGTFAELNILIGHDMGQQETLRKRQEDGGAGREEKSRAFKKVSSSKVAEDSLFPFFRPKQKLKTAATSHYSFGH